MTKDPPKPKGSPWPRVESRPNDKVKPNNNNNNNIRLKRPLSAYNLFYQDERRNVLQRRNEQVQSLLRQQHGNTTDIMRQQQQLTKVGGVVGLTSHVASKWNALDDATKSRYYDMAALEKAQYRKAKRDMKKHNKMMIMKMQKQDMDDNDDADDEDNKEKEIIKKDGIQTHMMIPCPEIANGCGGAIPPSHSHNDGMTLRGVPTLAMKPPPCPEVELDPFSNMIFHEVDDSIGEETFLSDMFGSSYVTTTKSIVPSATLADSSDPFNSMLSTTTTTEDSQDMKPPPCPEVELDPFSNMNFHEVDESIGEEAFLSDMFGSSYVTTTKSIVPSSTLGDSNMNFPELDEFIMKEVSLLDMSGSSYVTTTKSSVPSATLADSSDPFNSMLSTTGTTTTEDSQDNTSWWRSIQQLHFDFDDEEKDFFISKFLPSYDSNERGHESSDI